VLVAKAICKRFGHVDALAGVDFQARTGEIHAIVGENGAGKSTLINILAGRQRADSGTVMLDGTPLNLGSAANALRRGVAAVYQSSMLFERMSWEENLAFGDFCPGRGFGLDRVRARATLLASELGFALPPGGATIEKRSVAERVRLEIIRALSFNPRVLILDEPTGVLAPHELAPFLELLRRLRGEGRIVLLVTHKLAEALAVAERITVLRRGRVVAERASSDIGEAELAKLMLGEATERAPFQNVPESTGQPALELEAVTLEWRGRRLLDGISLKLYQGSVAGIAGVDGNGQNELVEVLAGVIPLTSGSIRLNDSNARSNAKVDEGLAVIPQNRDLDGLILDMALWENLLLCRALRKRAGAWLGWIRRAQATAFCVELLRKFKVRAAGPYASAASLSGGNRQRFIVARALSGAPRAIVAHDVCRGLDLGAIAEVYSRLRAYAAGGGSVLLISSDLDELQALCGRLYVISRGRLYAVPPDARNPAEIGLMMAGATQ
jgi:general nucleoside transport system ATP-binding protein